MKDSGSYANPINSSFQKFRTTSSWISKDPKRLNLPGILTSDTRTRLLDSNTHWFDLPSLNILCWALYNQRNQSLVRPASRSSARLYGWPGPSSSIRQRGQRMRVAAVF